MNNDIQLLLSHEYTDFFKKNSTSLYVHIYRYLMILNMIDKNVLKYCLTDIVTFGKITSYCVLTLQVVEHGLCERAWRKLIFESRNLRGVVLRTVFRPHTERHFNSKPVLLGLDTNTKTSILANQSSKSSLLFVSNIEWRKDLQSFAISGRYSRTVTWSLTFAFLVFCFLHLEEDIFRQLTF